MKSNPAKTSLSNRRVNVGRVIETLKVSSLKTTLANIEYGQVLDRTWRDFDTGSKKAS